MNPIALGLLIIGSGFLVVALAALAHRAAKAIGRALRRRYMDAQMIRLGELQRAGFTFERAARIVLFGKSEPVEPPYMSDGPLW